jgi:hypothetical protein
MKYVTNDKEVVGNSVFCTIAEISLGHRVSDVYVESLHRMFPSVNIFSRVWDGSHISYDPFSLFSILDQFVIYLNKLASQSKIGNIIICICAHGSVGLVGTEPDDTHNGVSYAYWVDMIVCEIYQRIKVAIPNQYHHLFIHFSSCYSMQGRDSIDSTVPIYQRKTRTPPHFIHKSNESVDTDSKKTLTEPNIIMNDIESCSLSHSMTSSCHHKKQDNTSHEYEYIRISGYEYDIPWKSIANWELLTLFPLMLYDCIDDISKFDYDSDKADNLNECKVPSQYHFMFRYCIYDGKESGINVSM